jgi:hypothetical protein
MEVNETESPCLITRNGMKICGGVEVLLHAGPERGEMEPVSVKNVGPPPQSESNINVLKYLINILKDQIFYNLLKQILNSVIGTIYSL